jgi:hypothetical protein
VRKTLQILILLSLMLVPAAANGDGFDNPRGPTTNEGPRTLGGALSIEGGRHRFVSLTPRTRPQLSLIAQIDKRDATIDRWWYLHGEYMIPVVAGDGDRSPSGLSADGGTLVLTTLPRAYPPKQSTFAVLNTRSSHHAITHLRLPGAFTFHAISPDGSRIYLIQYFYSGAQVTHYLLRALDTATGRLLPGRIIARQKSEKRLEGAPISRLQSPDGRWAYTLYGGKSPFLQALDTVHGRAIQFELPQLEGGRASLELRMRLVDGGDRIEVYPASAQGGRSQTGRGVEIDTETFEVSRPQPGPTATASGVSSDDVPWLALAAVAAAVSVAVALRRRVDH